MWQKIKEWSDQLSAIQNLLSLLALPWVASILAAIAGYFGSPIINPMWLVVGVSLVFAASVQGLFYAMRYSILMSETHKLEYIGPFQQTDCLWNETPHPTCIKSVQIGVQVVNKAVFPLHFKISSLRITANGRASDVARLEGRMNEIGAGTANALFSDAIDLSDLKLFDTKGLLEFEINYGKSADKLNQTIKKKQEFDLSVRQELSQKPIVNVGISVRDRN